MHKFTITNHNNLSLVGTVATPANPIGLSFVIHGLGSHRESRTSKELTDTLFENNYIVVAIDATNSFNESGGRYEDANMKDHYLDLVDVINWAKIQDWYQEPFVLAGHSLGGYAVARYAEDYPSEVKGVFVFAAVVSGELSMKAHHKRDPVKFAEWEKVGWKEEHSESRPDIFRRLPWSHMEERLDHDLRPNASHLAMPVLFVVGENDSSCPPYTQKTLYDLVPGVKEMHIVPGASHTFRNPEDLQKLHEIFSKWLKKLN